MFKGFYLVKVENNMLRFLSSSSHYYPQQTEPQLHVLSSSSFLLVPANSLSYSTVLQKDQEGKKEPRHQV